MTSKSAPAEARQLLPGAEIELAFTDLLANGQAVGRTAGRVVFCFGPLPGERAQVRITEVKPRYAVAQALQRLCDSTDRATPFCPVFGTCGGCQVQHLSYEAQLAWKRDLVHAALTRIGGLANVAVLPTIGMRDPRAYRNKMALVIDPAHARAGFYRQRSHEIVEIDGCPIVLPALDAQIPNLNGLRSRKETAALFDGVRHIVARSSRSSGQTVLTFTTANRSPGLRELAQRIPAEVAGSSNSYELSSANAILGRKHEPLAGAQFIEEEIGGIRYRVSSASFFQINVEIVERIFESIRSHFQDVSSVADLYCGAGTFSLFFAKLGARVLGLEENPAAIAEARTNASLNGMQGLIRFECGRVEKLLRRDGIRRLLERADIVFLDPPRKGSDEATLSAVVDASPHAIWYLSCDPATLARDLKFLTAKGYGAAEIQPFDMFPQTGHVETLVILHRRLE